MQTDFFHFEIILTPSVLFEYEWYWSTAIINSLLFQRGEPL